MSSKKFRLPKIRYPLERAKKLGYYLYHDPIEASSGARVHVTGLGELIMMGSYSYLGLIGHPRVNAASRDALAAYGTGTHGVRLLAGTTSLHLSLEKRIAKFKHTEAAIAYSSGYLANLAVISTLIGPKDMVFCDQLNHASIVDACRLSASRLIWYRHNDMAHLEQRLAEAEEKTNKLVVVDAVFSMDGDIVNLPEVSRLCRKYGALLMVDEAHSLGVLGETGHGIEEHFGLPWNSIDIKMGSLSKTIPSVGGYIAGTENLINLLKHESRPFIFSGALPPPQTAAALAALEIIEENPQLVNKLQQNAVYFRNRLTQLGFNTLQSETAIVPIICGTTLNAVKMAKSCRELGIFVQPILSPAVPENTERLRCTVTSNHSIEDINECLQVIEKAGKKLNILRI